MIVVIRGGLCLGVIVILASEMLEGELIKRSLPRRLKKLI